LKGTGAQVEDQFIRSSASPLQRFSIVPGGQGSSPIILLARRPCAVGFDRM